MNLFAVMYAYVPDPFRWLETFRLMEHMTLMMKLPNTIGNVCVIMLLILFLDMLAFLVRDFLEEDDWTSNHILK